MAHKKKNTDINEEQAAAADELRVRNAYKMSEEKKQGRESHFGDKINTNGFKQNPQNAGRKKSTNRFKELIERHLGGGAKVSAQDISDAQLALLSMSEAELLEIIDCKDLDKYPMFVKIIATSQVNSLRTGNVDTSFKLLERVAGKAPQDVTIKADIKQSVLNVGNLSTSELEALNNILDKATASKEDSEDD